jgi:hypothetical protein
VAELVRLAEEIYGVVQMHIVHGAMLSPGVSVVVLAAMLLSLFLEFLFLGLRASGDLSLSS